MTEERTADASATRAFFVDMLVRDISIDGAILDLVDNAVDAADRQSTDGDLDGLSITLDLSADQFRIVDNCGGISVDVAENYAFRFGRPDDFQPNTRIGQFGIGMKRAVFRLGRHFTVDSSTPATRFVVDVDIDAWRDGTGSWTFPLTIADEPSSEPGTAVTVTSLRAGVAEHFDRPTYPRTLLRNVAHKHEQAIRRGLQITVNGTPSDILYYKVVSGSGFSPEHQEHRLESDGHPVTLQIVAGIGPTGEPVADSGWYVYCNGRLVLRADRTELTGWGIGDHESDSEIPAWHSQYRRFRGFAFFTAESPTALPWTTTKDEIDASSPVYRTARQHMQAVIRSFVNFTNALKKESDSYEEGLDDASQPLNDALDKAALQDITTLPQGKFKVPEGLPATQAASGPSMTSIQFPVEAQKVQDLKDALGLKTNRQVGQRAFERLYKQELGDT